jgi:hypothetical protein
VPGLFLALKVQHRIRNRKFLSQLPYIIVAVNRPNLKNIGEWKVMHRELLSGYFCFGCQGRLLLKAIFKLRFK